MDFGTEEQLICYNCGGERNEYYCPCCDAEWSSDDDFIYVGDSTYCSDCVGEYCFVDDYYGDWVENDFLVSIALVDKKYNPDKEFTYEYLTVGENTLNSSHFKKLVPYKQTAAGEYYVDFNKVTDSQILDRLRLVREGRRTEYLKRIA